MSTDGGTTWSDLPGLTSPVTITGLGYGVTYSVKIRAVNSRGAGTASAAKSATTTKLTQTISFTQPANMKVGQADQSLTVSTTAVGLSVSLASTPA
ncbi:MAG: fibronectin type III domain-containing protein, partial [Actinobacteria bacterium]|nr:fibronectin type III domain-containing protein [Actinomycetota bacterium]